eukprot:616031-Pelagomonas_calceolata.AAC.1
MVLKWNPERAKEYAEKKWFMTPNLDFILKSSHRCNHLGCPYWFSQTKDTVPRLQIWGHLQRSAIMMPTPLFRAINKMYRDDGYVLVNGGKKARVHPTNGLKQGSGNCQHQLRKGVHIGSKTRRLVYINDKGRDISVGIRGAMTGDGVNAMPVTTPAKPCLVKRRCLPLGALWQPAESALLPLLFFRLD